MRKPEAWVSWRWWEQEGLDLVGAREQTVDASVGEEERGGKSGGAGGDNEQELMTGV